MAVQASGGFIGGWIKAGVTSVLGLVSGATLMYLTPLVNNAVKPSKPLANFAYQAQGLTVTFQNRANGGNEGWWDFGDGSALEPFAATQDTVVHTYTRPGNYAAKLSIRNFLGEENERTVPLVLDSAAAPTPVIEAFQVVPIRPDCTAPATFRLVSKIKNADMCILSLGDDRPLEFMQDVASAQDRLITYKEPGYYNIKLIAVHGKQTAEKAEMVFVNLGESGQPTATLQVSYEASRKERREKAFIVPVAFPPKGQGNTFPFQIEHKAELGYDIQEARLGNLAKGDVRLFKAPPQVEIAADRSRVWVKGELIKAGNVLQRHLPPPSVGLPIVLVQEKRGLPVVRPAEPVMINVTIPGVSQLPIPALPSNWELKKRQLTLQLHEGKNLVWQDTKLPVNTIVRLKNRTCRLTAMDMGNQVKLEMVEVTSPAR